MKMCSPALQIMTSNMSSAWLEPTKSSPTTPASAISAPMRRIFHSLARQLPEEFEHAALPLREVLDVDEIVVEHSVKTVVGDAVDQDAREEVPDAAPGQEDVPVVQNTVPHDRLF